jgi:hypothetical protein
VNRLKRHLSVANVLSATALFVALSGAAYATSHMTKNSVKTRHLGKGAVTTQKLRNGAVTTPKLRNGAVIAAKLRNDSVVTAKLADGAVRAINLGGGVVTAPKLKNGAVENSKLGANAVTTGKIGDGAVTAAKLAPSFLAQLVKNVSYETKESTLKDSSTPKEATVDCPAGKVAIAGGAKVIGGTTVALTDDGPLPPNAEGKRVGWSVAAAEMVADGGNWHVEAYVICAEL